MAYTTLDIREEQIRLLRFNHSSASNDSSRPLCLALETVSLKELNSDYAIHLNSSQPDQLWNDTFVPLIECRRAAFNPRHNGPQQPAPQLQDRTRFTWGDYEALSYTWGDGQCKVKIQLNGVLTQISSDLEIALRALQRLPETRSGMKYWIDALCINQKDLDEQSVQVKRMKSIYGSARSVVVWLGPRSGDDDVAFETMRRLYRDKTKNNWLVIPSGFGAEHWRALCNFMRKPYWNRLWIIQELAANRHSTLFICGEEEITRETLRLAAQCCQKIYKEDAPYARQQTDLWEITSRLLRLINLTSDVPKDVMLRKALSLSRQAMASKEKDKVYGILALLDDSISRQVDPNYENLVTIQDVFTALTIAIIEATKSVEQIIYSSHQVPDWPSWVSDLRLPFLRHHMHQLRQCQATGTRHCKISLCRQQDTNMAQLRVEGIKVDYVDGVAASPALDDLPLFPRHHNRRYEYDSAEALGKTLVFCHPCVRGRPVFMKIPWGPKNQSSQSALASQEYLQFEKFRSVNQSFVINGEPLRFCFPRRPRTLPKPGLLRHHLKLTAITSKGRKLITTNTGYLGLVPDCVQRDDVVTVLLGCNFPVLLRPYRNGYHVLGECYIHGLMKGEMFEAQGGEHLLYHGFVLL
jgi:hypothetical protein